MNSARPWLLPFVPLYHLGLALARLRQSPVRRLRWPVVSIGNLSTGGAGKTPLAIALAKALTVRGMHVDVLSRGYGRRRSKTAARVDLSGTAELFGDEPLVIARQAGVPVYVAAQRYQAGLLAENEHPGALYQGMTSQLGEKLGALKEHEAVLKGHDLPGPLTTGLSRWGGLSRATNATKKEGALAPEGTSFHAVHLLDDGFQHRQLARDVDILLLDRRDWTDSLLPAGNLRDPLAAARRATVIAIPAADSTLESELRSWGWRKTIWRLHRRMEIPPIEGQVAAFCGIARPEQFFAGLEAAGVHVASRTVFADHHCYVQHDFDCLLDAARNVRATALVTTEKDLARLGKLAAALPESIPLRAAQLRIEIEDEQSAVDWLINCVNPSATSPKPT